MSEFIAFGIHFGKPNPPKPQLVARKGDLEFTEFEQPIYLEPSDESECPPGG